MFKALSAKGIPINGGRVFQSLFYKNRGDIQNDANDKSIKLMRDVLKLLDHRKEQCRPIAHINYVFAISITRHID